MKMLKYKYALLVFCMLLVAKIATAGEQQFMISDDKKYFGGAENS